MNNMIEFRGMREDNKEWAYGWLAEPNVINVEVRNVKFYVEVMEDILVIPETVGQWTGEKDKLERKSYKGDIIEFTFRGKVYTDNIEFGNAMFFVTIPLEKGWRQLPLWYLDGDYTIIGNIHENKGK